MCSNVLIVEDDLRIVEDLGLYLESCGMRLFPAESGLAALSILQRNNIHLVLADIMLPDMSGYELVKRIRAESPVPIIILSAKAQDSDRILGLDLGADDYIVKPFSAREVVARVKAVLRRLAMAKEQPQQVLRFDDLEININNYDVRVKGERVPFTPKEVEIFQLLASHPGKVYERETILSLVWGYDFYGDTRAVDTQIKRIRQKLPPEGSTSWSIKTVYGVGYKFEVREK